MRVLLLALSFFAAITSTPSAAKIHENLPNTNYINLQVTNPLTLETVTIGGEYRTPKNIEQPVPAVLVLHSSSGVDSTGRFYIKKFNKLGYATLELDLFGGRALSGGSESRPESPLQTLPDAFEALKFLANRPEIDQNKIAVIGFSWGGVMAMLSATEQYASLMAGEYRFAAHIAHYPVCWAYNNVPGFEFAHLTNAPVLIQTGELDDYDLPDTCSNMVASLPEHDVNKVSVNLFKNAYHAWDRLEPRWEVVDPFAHLGQGGQVILSPDQDIARKSRRKAVKFLKAAFQENAPE